MRKSPTGLIILSILAFLVGGLNLFVGYSHEGNSEYRVVGFICMALGLGLFRLWNWARIVTMVLSLGFVVTYVIGLIQIFIFRPVGWQWGAMALTAFSPVLLLSIGSIGYLTRPKVKEQFKKS